jgi:hypothetical protein
MRPMIKSQIADLVNAADGSVSVPCAHAPARNRTLNLANCVLCVLLGYILSKGPFFCLLFEGLEGR